MGVLNWLPLLGAFLAVLIGANSEWDGHLSADLRGDYCRSRSHRGLPSCCPGRDDTCTAPILGTVCYCDIFCDRQKGDDCCPDYNQECLGAVGAPPPATYIHSECPHEGRFYKINHSIRINCNRCTCVQRNSTLFEFACDQHVCLMRPEFINAINKVQNEWHATNYSFFWGDTLQEGIAQRLGTFKPTRPTTEMNEIVIPTNGPLPEFFDARQRWQGLIGPPRNQGRHCASSWAFSTTDLASDRLAIESLGTEKVRISPQHFLSCQQQGQRGCDGGHLDKAWYFFRKDGLTSEECFPYISGESGQIPPCPFKVHSHNGQDIISGVCVNGEQPRLYQITPPYRIGPKEEDIMREIYFNGPVQATFQVHEDLFYYQSGVYRHLGALTRGLPEAYRQHGWHSVRIIGWGVENINGKQVKYWLCANSWGDEWGENGYFRILRGEDECDIEMFIVGVWAKIDIKNIV